jgi:hypothetical protein
MTIAATESSCPLSVEVSRAMRLNATATTTPSRVWVVVVTLAAGGRENGKHPAKTAGVDAQAA